jgi:RNA polymerase sigma-70 factor (ECF subfamily)
MTNLNTTRLQRCLEDFRAGNPQAREHFLHLSLERLRSFAQRMLACYARVARWEQTDDLLQNVYLRLERTLQQVPFTTAREFLSLAATHVRHELIDLARHHYGPQGHGRHHATPNPAQADAPEVVVAGNSAQQIAIWIDLHEAIDKLPERERQIFDLRWYQDLTINETAEVAGISVAEVKRRWRSARLLLAERLGDWEAFFLEPVAAPLPLIRVREL